MIGQQIIFIILLVAVAVIAYRSYGKIVRAIGLGNGTYSFEKGRSNERWKRVLLIAFGQKKMFKRWIPAIFHFFIYAAFLLTQIELIEIILDGTTGGHRLLRPMLGGFYTFLINSIEILSFLALIATVIFLWRRNVRRVDRFEHPEMTGWPKSDANYILFGEIVLVIGIFMMNGADSVLQDLDPTHYPDTGNLFLSSIVGSWLSGVSLTTLQILERVGWWLHILVVFGFILYLPFSKHLHIFFAFPNVYFSKLSPKGEMDNMPEVMKEVKGMLGLEPMEENLSDEIPDFGANDIFGLHWKNILDAYTCTECGRCTAVCPANMTGKKLSPRKIMMDVRDRATYVIGEIQKNNTEFLAQDKSDQNKLTRENYDDGKTLFDSIAREEIHACTTCNACVEACPVLINPLDIILSLRRYEILTESAGPSDWVPMFTSLENSGSVWQVSQDRDHWTKNLTE